MAKSDFKQQADRALASMQMDEALRQRVHTAIAWADSEAAGAKPETTRPKPEAARKRRKTLRLRKALLTVVASCLVLVLGVGAAAAVFPSFERFLQRMGEDLRSIVHPVGMVAQHQGIRMEVLAAATDAGEAIVYLSLIDEKGSRIDEQTSLSHLELDGATFCHAEQVDYNAETGEAIYRVSATGIEPLGGAETSLSLYTILLGEEYLETPLSLGLTAADIRAANPQPTFPVPLQPDETGFVGNYGMTYGATPETAEALRGLIERGEVPLLAENAAPLEHAVDWLDIKAAGIDENNLLHVQYAPATHAAQYAMADLFLTWPGGPQNVYDSTPVARISQGERREEGFHDFYDYYEAVFPLPQDVPEEDIQLVLGGFSVRDVVQDTWNVQFTLEENLPVLAADVDVDLNGWRVYRLKVSSIGFTTYGEGEIGETSGYADVRIYLADGTEVQAISSTSSVEYGDDGDKMVDTGGFARPISLEDVGRVTLNGEEVALNPAQ